MRQGSGPPLVVINGLAATSEDWDPTFIAGLAADNRLLLIDNRGMGACPDDGAPFTIDDLAQDVAAQMDGAAAVLGWSMGGFVAQKLALDHPELVRKLVLLSTTPGGPDTKADPKVIDQLIDTSPPADEQARRLLSLLFDDEFARELYAQAGDVVAAARGRLNPDVLARQRSAPRRLAPRRSRRPAHGDLRAHPGGDRKSRSRHSSAQFAPARDRDPGRLAASVSARRPRVHGSVSGEAVGRHQRLPGALGSVSPGIAARAACGAPGLPHARHRGGTLPLPLKPFRSRRSRV